MDSKSSPFQIGILAIFLVLGLLGIIIFALTSSAGQSEEIGDVTVWGTFNQRDVETFLHDQGAENRELASVQYQQKDPKTFYEQLAQAIASNRGPDLIITDQAHIEKYKGTLAVIPYTEYPQRLFKDAFIDATEVLLTNEGVIGVPMAVDPLVLYWNRDIFSRKNIPKPPQFWNEVLSMTEKITERDESGNITLSAIALGEPSNVTHAKEIIALMVMQAGGDIIVRTENGQLDARLARSDEQGLSPGQSAVRYFGRYSNPTLKIYTWNRSLPNALDAFVNGDLAMYIGTASELNTILEKNPNLNFDIKQIPLIEGSKDTRAITTGNLYVLAIPKTAKNLPGAKKIAGILTTGTASKKWEDILKIPSPQRALLGAEPKDALVSTLREATLKVRLWPDPEPEMTQDTLYRMIDRVSTGADRISESVQRADAELKIIIRDLSR